MRVYPEGGEKICGRGKKTIKIKITENIPPPSPWGIKLGCGENEIFYSRAEYTLLYINMSQPDL